MCLGQGIHLRQHEAWDLSHYWVLQTIGPTWIIILEETVTRQVSGVGDAAFSEGGKDERDPRHLAKSRKVNKCTIVDSPSKL